MLSEELIKQSLVPGMLARAFGNINKTDEFNIICYWKQWTINYYNADECHYSADDEVAQAKQLYKITAGNIKDAIDYLEHLCLKKLPINGETWAEFIINRRNVGTKVGTKQGKTTGIKGKTREALTDYSQSTVQ